SCTARSVTSARSPEPRTLAYAQLSTGARGVADTVDAPTRRAPELLCRAVRLPLSRAGTEWTAASGDLLAATCFCHRRAGRRARAGDLAGGRGIAGRRFARRYPGGGEFVDRDEQAGRSGVDQE